MAKRAGKLGRAGRFVTLRSGRVIFIPAGKRSKWADVRGRIRERKGRRSKQWWGKWGNVKGGGHNPQAALEAAEVNDPSALATFSRPVLMEASARTEHPTLKRRLRGAMARSF